MLPSDGLGRPSALRIEDHRSQPSCGCRGGASLEASQELGTTQVQAHRCRYYQPPLRQREVTGVDDEENWGPSRIQDRPEPWNRRFGAGAVDYGYQPKLGGLRDDRTAGAEPA